MTSITLRVALASVFALAALALHAATPDTVTFASADGKAQLVGYVFMPSGSERHPAIVMLHGRAGAYSSLKRGTYTADTLSASLEQMQLVEDMRRTLREVRDVNKLDSN